MRGTRSPTGKRGVGRAAGASGGCMAPANGVEVMERTRRSLNRQMPGGAAAGAAACGKVPAEGASGGRRGARRSSATGCRIAGTGASGKALTTAQRRCQCNSKVQLPRRGGSGHGPAATRGHVAGWQARRCVAERKSQEVRTEGALAAGGGDTTWWAEGVRSCIRCSATGCVWGKGRTQGALEAERARRRRRVQGTASP